MPLKDVIQEQIGDDIVSAIDFTLNVEIVEDSKAKLFVQKSQFLKLCSL